MAVPEAAVHLTKIGNKLILKTPTLKLNAGGIVLSLNIEIILRKVNTKTLLKFANNYILTE